MLKPLLITFYMWLFVHVVLELSHGLVELCVRYNSCLSFRVMHDIVLILV